MQRCVLYCWKYPTSIRKCTDRWYPYEYTYTCAMEYSCEIVLTMIYESGIMLATVCVRDRKCNWSLYIKYVTAVGCIKIISFKRVTALLWKWIIWYWFSSCSLKCFHKRIDLIQYYANVKDKNGSIRIVCYLNYVIWLTVDMFE